MRRLIRAAAVGLVAGLSVVPAHAAGGASIDYVESNGSTVTMLFSVPAELTPADRESLTVEVDGHEVDATAKPVQAGDVARTTVLALDVSSSMRGARFEAAKAAALAYLAEAPSDVLVGLVTFAGDVTVVESPTTDHTALATAVKHLELSSGTALYDGILEAVVQVGTEGQRDVIVLSDGADTTETAIGDVVSAVTEADVSVSVVALQQTAAARAKLRQITTASNGAVLPADDAAALKAVFEREADALAQQLAVTFEAPSSGEVTVNAVVTADGRTYSDAAFTTLHRPREAAADRAEPLPVDVPAPAVDERFLYIGIVALGVGLAGVLGVLLTRRAGGQRTSYVERQLNFYAGSQQQPGTAGGPPKAQLSLRESAVAAADKVVQRAGFEERLTQRLTKAGVALTSAEWLLLHAGITVVGGLLGFLLGTPVTMVLFLAVGALGPWLYLGVKAGRRLKAFGTQLPDTLQLMSGGLSAGLSLPQAVDTVVREGSEPMTAELRRALVEQRLGVGIEEALDSVAERMDSKDFAWVVMAIRIQREVGGNLAELLNNVAATMREREYLRRQVKTLSAEGRLSAFILGGLPPGLALYLSVSRPDYLEPMYTTPLGLAMTVSALVLLAMGAFVMKSVVKVEV